MDDKKRKIIMISISVAILIIAIIAIAFTVLKKPKKEEVVVEDIYKLPQHVMYYVNDDIYDEKIDKATINNDIKVDFTQYDIKSSYKKNLNIDLQKDLTMIQSNKGNIYGLYDGSVVSVNFSNKIRKITPENENVFCFKMYEGNIIRYSQITDLNGKQEYALTVSNLYNEENKILSNEKVKSLDVDKDGIYVVYETGKLKDKIVRYLWTDYQEFVIEEDSSDKIVKAEDWIYYINRKDGDKIYRVYKDGTRKNKITDNKVELSETAKKSYDGSSFMNGYLDTLYYIDSQDGNKLYKLEVSENQKEVISKENIKSFKLIDGYIYYTLNDKEGLYVMHKDGTYVNKILDKDPKQYVVIINEIAM